MFPGTIEQCGGGIDSRRPSDACPKAGRRCNNAGWLNSGTNLEYTPIRTGGRKLDPREIFDIQSFQFCVAGVVAALLWASGAVVCASPSVERPLDDARGAFYNSRFEEASSLTVDLCAAGDLDACELRTSALLMQIRRAFGDPKDKEKAFAACAKCQTLFDAFMHDTSHGQALARARLKADPADEPAQFLLGKLDLNYVWLQLGTLGRRTGWGEYWEARHTLDAILKHNPHNVRAKVARAWIDYIVDTRMPRGTRWVLGGGNKKRALVALREAAKADTDIYTSAEARFGLWDVLVREKNFPEAVDLARQLAKDFPKNSDLPQFLAEHPAGP
jgi:hypothetical protein